MKKVLPLLPLCLFLIYLFIHSLYPAAYQSHPKDWAQQDLNYIHEAIIENHPGIYNSMDPTFRANLESNFLNASQSISQAINDNEKIDILTKFIKAFDDRHLAINYIKRAAAPVQCIDTKTFSSHVIKPGIRWIYLPTFNPNHRQLKELQDIITLLPTWRSEQALVFDLRANDGGNSQFGEDIVESLFGQAYAHQRIKSLEAASYVDWRASKGNLEHLKLITSNQLQIVTAKNIIWLNKIIEGIQKAIQAHEPFFTEKTTPPTSHTDIQTVENPVKARIFVITDNTIFSASLDFIDYLKAMQVPITLVGQTTQADSLYMECRIFELPSKKGKLCLPIKVYRNRKRGHNEPYVPDIFFDTQNTESLQHFISKLINQDIPT